jgi:hypothetical protein
MKTNQKPNHRQATIFTKTISIGNRSLAAILFCSALLLAGCADLEVADRLPVNSAKGYAEFIPSDGQSYVIQEVLANGEMKGTGLGALNGRNQRIACTPGLHSFHVYWCDRFTTSYASGHESIIFGVVEIGKTNYSINPETPIRDTVKDVTFKVEEGNITLVRFGLTAKGVSPWEKRDRIWNSVRCEKLVLEITVGPVVPFQKEAVK